MGLLRLYREARAGVRAARIQRRADKAGHGKTDAQLDDIEARLSNTVREVADTLDQRAELLREQRARETRRNGGHGRTQATGA